MKAFLILLLMAATVKEPLDGAFGVKFGQKFDPKDSIRTIYTTMGTPVYEIKPPSPVNEFSEYSVRITPISHQIYAIDSAVILERGQYAATLKELKKFLTKKYGPPVGSDEEDDVVFWWYHFESKGGRIFLQFKPNVEGQQTLVATFINTVLEDQNDKEEKELAEKADRDLGGS